MTHPRSRVFVLVALATAAGCSLGQAPSASVKVGEPAVLNLVPPKSDASKARAFARVVVTEFRQPNDGGVDVVVSRAAARGEPSGELTRWGPSTNASFSTKRGDEPQVFLVNLGMPCEKALASRARLELSLVPYRGTGAGAVMTVQDPVLECR